MQSGYAGVDAFAFNPLNLLIFYAAVALGLAVGHLMARAVIRRARHDRDAALAAAAQSADELRSAEAEIEVQRGAKDEAALARARAEETAARIPAMEESLREAGDQVRSLTGEVAGLRERAARATQLDGTVVLPDPGPSGSPDSATRAA